MKKAICKLVSLSPYGQNKFVQTEKLAKELHDDYEKRTWRDRAHVDENNEMFIPPGCFKNCISDAAQFLGEKIPGQRNATWTKHFAAGVMVIEPLKLGIKKEEIKGHWQHVPSDGKPGGKSRVMKCFPYAEKWSGEVEFLIVDSVITQEAFTHHLEQAGSLIGIGVYRPRNRGYWGRFAVQSVKWIEE